MVHVTDDLAKNIFKEVTGILTIIKPSYLMTFIFGKIKFVILSLIKLINLSL